LDRIVKGGPSFNDLRIWSSTRRLGNANTIIARLASLSSARGGAESAARLELERNPAGGRSCGRVEDRGEQEASSGRWSISCAERNTGGQVERVLSISAGTSRTLYKIEIKALGKNLDIASTYLKNATGKINPGSPQGRVRGNQNNCETAQRLGRVDVDSDSNLLR
jgi:hypothetical protein